MMKFEFEEGSKRVTLQEIFENLESCANLSQRAACNCVGPQNGQWLCPFQMADVESLMDGAFDQLKTPGPESDGHD